MELVHVPVLLNECLDLLNIKSNGIYVDGTIGGGGHSEEILKLLGNDGILIGIDKDSFAIEMSEKRLKKIETKAGIILVNNDFRNMEQIFSENKIDRVDGILLDLGVSSFQFDIPNRGFGYKNDALLDMRMDRTQELTAQDIVNNYNESDIARIIKKYGEERWASRIASFVVNERNKKEITSTFELVDIIKAAIPASARRKGSHPAKKTFQALRIAVNQELESLENVIEKAVGFLKKGGRLLIISFHSLEDRIVKNGFQRIVNPCTCPKDFPICICGKKPKAKYITKKPIIPTEKEVKSNPRARSAKLRAIEKI
jgi:16S rRNA (cytosine1402-N4)-methyltransferase